MTATVRLRVAGVDLGHEPTLELLAHHLADMAWSETDGYVTMTVFVDPDKAVDEALAACHSLSTHVPGARVVRVDEELVATSDIAHRVGVSREAARKWASEPAFPWPHGTVGGGTRGASKVWAWADVARWLLDSRGLDMGEQFIDALAVAKINGHLAETPTATTTRRYTISGASRVAG